MQLTGDRFTSETAVMGNDLSTLPDFPAEIRAPAGSLPGVSGFQLHFADHDILTPGDVPNVLVAMNPAALRTNVKDLPKGGMLIVDTDTFKERNLLKAGYESSPLEDGSLADYHLHEVALTSMTVEALKGIEGITSREAERSKNFFALGLMSWLYNRPTEGTLEYVEKKFAKRPEIAQANATAFKAGYAYGETSEDFAVSYEIAPAKMTPGVYRQISGNTAIAYGLIAASKLSGLDLFLGAYPITPCELDPRGAGAAQELWRPYLPGRGRDRGGGRGARRGLRRLARRHHIRRPGDRAEAGDDWPRDHARAPAADTRHPTRRHSTGMPTKPEQADLLMVLFGRNSESPVPVLAASTPSQCFHAAIEAARIALKYRTPVYLLSDAYLANGSEPWLIPDVSELPDISTQFAAVGETEFQPYHRDPETLARPWAIPGTAGLEHRIGGLEKADVTGSISYDPENHDLMTRLRAAKVAGIANDIPELAVDDPDGSDTLVLGWGSTYGPIGAAVKRVRRAGHSVAQAHLHYLNPFPRNTGEVLRAYDKVLIPEMNLGQLLQLVRAEFLVDAVGYNRVRGTPFKASELAEAITALVES